MPKTTNQRHQIIITALKLFATRGYGSTSVRLIAKTAGVSHSLMYNFFVSKKDLLFQILTRGFDDIRESLESYNNTNLTPEQAIKEHITKTFEIINAHHELWRLLHTIRLQDKVISASKKMLSDMIGDILTTFTTVFKKLGHKKPDLEAILFLSQIDGLAVLYLQDPSIPINKLTQQLIDRYQK